MFGHLIKNLMIMKNLYLIAFLFFANISFSQDYIKIDSLKINETNYKTMHISDGSSSFYKAFAVIVVIENDLETVKNKIIQCYLNEKHEYTEIYLITLQENNIYKNIVLETFISTIDDYRMKNNLYTALIPYTVTPYFKFTYHTEQKKRNLNELKNLYFIYNIDDICNILKK